MVKILFLFSVLTLSFQTKGDILIIGDSHTAGPFGEFLHKNLTKELKSEIILTYGHSSSAPIHWMNTNPVKLSGGLNHHMSIDGSYYPHPRLPDWRILAESLSLQNIFEKPILHKEWESKLKRQPEFSHIVIALGANDKAAVSLSSGERKSEFDKRVKILKNLMANVKNKNLKCIWIAPPSSASSTDAAEETTFQYITEGIENQCPIYDSRKFKAVKCDQVHFNCKEEISIAKDWANEATEFVLKNL